MIALVTSTLNAEESIFKPFNNKSLKNVEINDLSNQKINIYNLLLKNKNYIINFWATWCLPCKKELPELQKIKTQHIKSKILQIGANFNKDDYYKITELLYNKYW